MHTRRIASEFIQIFPGNSPTVAGESCDRPIGYRQRDLLPRVVADELVQGEAEGANATEPRLLLPAFPQLGKPGWNGRAAIDLPHQHPQPDVDRSIVGP